MDPTSITEEVLDKVGDARAELEHYKEEYDKKASTLGKKNVFRIQMSANKISEASGISKSSVQNILKKDLHMKPYKISTNQLLKPADHQMRLDYAKRVIELMERRKLRIIDVMFTDECYVVLDKLANKQNVRYWSTERPDFFLEKEQYAEKLGMWAGICGRFVIGPYFLVDENGRNINVNSERYVNMIQNFVWPELVKIKEQNRIYFQQDGAPAHTAKLSMNALKQLFPGRLISSKGGDILWPARSPDLTSCDFFIWSFVKAYVFKKNPQNMNDLKRYVIEAFNSLTPEMLQNTAGGASHRLQIVSSPEINGDVFEHKL